MTPSDKLAAEKARSHFARLVLHAGASLDLAQSALLIAAEEDPRCNLSRCLTQLDAMGAEARERITRHEGSPIEAVNQYLFTELGFTGNQNNYYDPRNSLLNYVLEHHTGIPITLSIVFMEVGRRAGLRVEGINMPGHFIVRAYAEGSERGMFVDPFHGVTVDEEDCQQRLDALYGGQIPLKPEHLQPAKTSDILVRLLRNLKAVYVQARLYRKSLAVVDRILLLKPHDFDEHRDRGMLLAQLGRYHEAISEVQRYLSFMSNASDAETVREQMKKLQIRQAMLN